MKKSVLLIGLVTLSIITFSSAVQALSVGTIIVNVNGNVWTIPTLDFSGKDVTQIDVETYNVTGSTTTFYPLDPMQEILTPKQIILIFDTAELPDSVDGTRVTIHVGSDSVIATGPGFAWGRR